MPKKWKYVRCVRSPSKILGQDVSIAYVPFLDPNENTSRYKKGATQISISISLLAWAREHAAVITAFLKLGSWPQTIGEFSFFERRRFRLSDSKTITHELFSRRHN